MIKITSFISSISMIALAGITHVFAAEKTFQPLSAPTPGITDVKSLPELLNGLLGISVGIAAILAVIMLAIGGFKYMTTESVFQMAGAKEQIANAIIGLLIVLMAVLIMNTINPEITSLHLFS